MTPPTLPPAQVSRASFFLALLLLATLVAYVSLAGAEGADPACKGNSPKKFCVTLTPADGATVLGTVDVTADSKSNAPAVAVQFSLDDVPLGSEDTSAPFTAPWDTTRVSNGGHKLTAAARDGNGQTYVSQSNVTVDNPVPDTTPPSVQFTNPGEGSTVAGSTDLDVNASDNVGVVGVQFKVDGANLGPEDTSAPYSAAWDTTKAANGSHVLTAVARDNAGNSSTSQRSVKVSNTTSSPPPPATDTTAPTVQLTSPAANATVSGTVNVGASASDNVGVVGVQFKVDGAALGAEDTSAPYAASWNTTTVANGGHTVSAVARDAAGNKTTAQISVTVSNQSGPAPTPGLRWPAPTLTNPITLTVPTRGQESFSLAANQDYVIRFENGLRYGPLNFVGGRNLVLVGGEQIIDDTTSSDYGRRRLFEFRDQTGTIHIEGYYGHGPGLTEGINIWAPNAILQIEKSRIENVHRITADANPQHPDIIQTWSGPQELRLWRFTGSTDYQGFWFSYAEGYAGAVWPGKIVMEDVNLHPLPNPAWGGKGWNVDHMAFLNPATEFRLGNVWEETGWWNGTYHKGLKDSFGIRWSSTGGWSESNPLWSWQEFWANGSAAGPEHVAEPYNANYSDAAPPEQGGWIVFTRPSTDNIWNLDRSGSGKLFQGTPPGGDFVPASSVGANYGQ